MSLNFLEISCTLKKQLQLLFICSWLAVVLLTLFGGWRLQEFNKKNSELQQSSENLRNGLEKNFDDLRNLTAIQTNLRTYLQSAPPGILVTIHQLSEKLYNGLPAENQAELTAFLKKLETLEIRMNSFRLNNESLVGIEREILEHTDNLLIKLPVEEQSTIWRFVNQTSLRHHNLYTQVIILDEQSSLQRLNREYEQMFAHIEEEIEKISKKIAPENSIALKKLQISYYKLDEAVSTITAIRLVTLETKKDIKNKFLAMRDVVTNSSLSQANGLEALIQSGMSFLKANLIVMSLIMIMVAFLGGITALVLSRSMVTPLISFTGMLQEMTRMLSGLRRQNEFEQGFSKLLDSMTDRKDDEIGRVAKAVKQLLLRLRELALFRQDIEDDESLEEVYKRLGRVFSKQLGLTSFVIFERIKGDDTTMRVAHQEMNIDGVDELPEIQLDNKCRGRCNNRVISSFKDSETCSRFPRSSELRHVCIPMQISGQVIGVVQFLFPLDIVDCDYQQVTDSLYEAMHYITEALPVLHAKRLTLRLQAMAMKDQLTGLANRHYLETSLDRLVAGIRRRESSLCVLMCDIDHFKNINDSYGHDAGDLILSQLAQILKSSVRETDYVIRFGGEEFLILLVDSDPDFSRTMAERIRDKVEQFSFKIPGDSIRMTISMGTAPFSAAPEQDIHDSFKHADIALYQAKGNGRNQVVMYADTEHCKKQADSLKKSS